MKTGFQSKKWLVLLVFLVLFLYGLSTVRDYGRTWDANAVIRIVEQNWVEYAQRLLPEDNAVRRWADTSGRQPISKGLDRDHGMAVYYGFAPFYARLRDNRGEMIYAWYTYSFCIYFLGVIAVYFLLRELYAAPFLPMAGTLFYYFTPRFFAEGHFNDRDLILLSLSLLCLLFALRAMKKLVGGKGGWGDVVCFSVVSGFLMNGRILGIAVWGLVGLFTILYVITRGGAKRASAWGGILAAVGLSCAFYVLLTPASWAGIAALFRFTLDNANHFANWNAPIRFRGEIIWPARNGTPRAYLPLWMLITIPAYISALFALSCLCFFVTTLREKGRNLLREDSDFFFLLLIVGFAAPFCYIELKAHTMVLYNSWRHMYFLYAFLFPAALYVLDRLYKRRQRSPGRREKRALTAACALTALCFCCCAGEMLYNRGFEYVYTNLLSRQFIDPNDYETDYWLVSEVPCLQELARREWDGEHPLTVGMVYLEINGVEPTMLGEDQFVFKTRADADYEESAYYLFDSASFWDWSYEEDFEQYEKLFSFRHFGAELAGIYVKNAAKQEKTIG